MSQRWPGACPWLTLELLETHGVPVIGFGTAKLPAFFSRQSGFAVDYRLDDPAHFACVMREMGPR